MTLNSNYEVKSNNYYRGLVDKAYVIGKQKLQDKIRQDRPASVSLQMDGWTAAHTGYMGAICDYINDNWERESVVLACNPYTVRHSSEKIADWMIALVKDWQLNYVLDVVTTDSAANMLGIFNLENFPDYYRSAQCANHLLQRVIENEIFSMKSIKTLIENVRIVTNFASSSNNFCHDLEEIQKKEDPDKTPLLLVNDVQTRWNSTYSMLARFLKLKESLTILLAKKEWSRKASLAKAKICQEDFTLMERVVKVLQAFNEVTEQLSHNSACISEVIPVVTILLAALDRGNDDLGVVGYKFNLRSKLREKMGHFESIDIYSLATLVDPRYRRTYFTDKTKAKTATKKLVSLINAEIEMEVPAFDDTLPCPVVAERETETANLQQSGSIIQQIAKKIRMEEEERNVEMEAGVVTAESLVELYLKEPLQEHKPLSYWKLYEKNAGNCKVKAAFLSVVKKLLTPPATSTNVERLFSIAGLISDKRRKKLLPQRLEKILFLRENLYMLSFKLEW